MANEKMIKGARILLECLSRLGINEIFGYPGGAVIPIYDELYSFKGIKHYFARHEQGAVHEADGYARSTGKVGACLATSGPGATNLVTGIMTAHMDSIPLLVITGQVSSSLLGKDAFQESDIVGITVPITKNNYLVQDIKDLPRILKEAYYIASTGRPGPVLVDIPRDIQLQEIPYDEFNKIYENHFSLEGYNPVYEGHKGQIKTAIKMIKDSKKPLIIAGAGILKAHAYEELKEFVEKTNIPVAMTLLGLGSFPGNHELALGMIGMHGTTYANYAANEADLIIAAGMRFDDRVTGNPQKFVPNAKIIHIDIDPAEIGKNKLIDVPIVGDLKNVLTDLNEKAPKVSYDEWLKQIKKWKKEYSLIYRKTEDDILIPQEILAEINKITKGDVIVATDVGQHQMFAALHYPFDKPRRWINSGGLGTMGFGLPAALGVKLADPKATVVCITGDGSIQMNIQELSTAKQYDIPIVVICLNNHFLGMVKQWQDLIYSGRHSQTYMNSLPDFVKLAEAYDHVGIQIAKPEELEEKLKQAFSIKNKLVFVDVNVDANEHVYPMQVRGGAMNEMILTKPENA